MKKFVFLSIGMVAFALQHANAQTSLFTTYDDWSAWGSGATADSTFSTDGSTVNGIGNLTAPGAAGTSGALLVSPANGYASIATGPSQGGNLAFLQAIDPGTDGNNTVAGSGEFYLDYSLPDNEGGSYFQLGVLLQYSGNGYYGGYFASSSTDLGYTDPTYGEEVYRATIPYPIEAGNWGGLGIGLLVSTDYNPALPFYVDNLTVGNFVAAPEPGTMALVGLGLTGLMLIRRRRQN